MHKLELYYEMTILSLCLLTISSNNNNNNCKTKNQYIPMRFWMHIRFIKINKNENKILSYDNLM